MFRTFAYIVTCVFTTLIVSDYYRSASPEIRGLWAVILVIAIIALTAIYIVSSLNDDD